MQRLTRPLLVLHDDAAFVDRLARAAATTQEVRVLRGWSDLRRALRTAPPGSITIVDPYWGSFDGLSLELRDVLRDFRSSTVLAAQRFEPTHYGDLRTLGQWGVAELICVGREDTRAALGRRMRQMEARPVDRILRQVVRPGTRGRTRTLLTAAAATVAAGGQAPELAASLDLTERTLLRWCARADLPPPRRLLAWLRVLLACDLLDDPGHTLASASRACGYAADMPLRRAIRNLVGAEPRDLREVGALATAAERFAGELAVLRAEGRAARLRLAAA